MQHCKYSPRENMVPDREVLLENQASPMGQAFTVFHANSAGSYSSGQTGQWWRTWGPWFWTYTYQDIHEETTIYMRPTLMGMVGLYDESRIMRCDGNETEVWFFGEGSSWISNRVRSWFGSIFGLQREGTFTVYKGSDTYGSAAEVFHGPTKSITFSRESESTSSGQTQYTLGSSVLQSNHDGAEDMWTMSITDNSETPFREQCPVYVMSAAAVLMAFHWITVRHEAGVHAGHTSLHSSPSPSPPGGDMFLAERSDASAPFVEEDEEQVHQDPEPLRDGDENANTEDAAGEKI
jgi:hypothetical protein